MASLKKSMESIWIIWIIWIICSELMKFLCNCSNSSGFFTKKSRGHRIPHPISVNMASVITSFMGIPGGHWRQQFSCPVTPVCPLFCGWFTCKDQMIRSFRSQWISCDLWFFVWFFVWCGQVWCQAPIIRIRLDKARHTAADHQAICLPCISGHCTWLKMVKLLTKSWCHDVMGGVLKTYDAMRF